MLTSNPSSSTLGTTRVWPACGLSPRLLVPFLFVLIHAQHGSAFTHTGLCAPVRATHTVKHQSPTLRHVAAPACRRSIVHHHRHLISRGRGVALGLSFDVIRESLRGAIQLAAVGGSVIVVGRILASAGKIKGAQKGLDLSALQRCVRMFAVIVYTRNNVTYMMAKIHRMPYFQIQFAQKKPIISGSFARKNLQLQASYASSPTCMSSRICQ